jgi:serine/threonine protein kinase
MDNTTKINSEILESPPTLINNEALASFAPLKTGAVICEKYLIERKLKMASGEADIYICSFNGSNFAAKLYKRKIATKYDVIEALKKINSPYVAKLYESAIYNGYPIEIIPYYKNGSLQGKRYTYGELKEIIRHINEGLKVIHDNNIIHKDLKPSNIMLSDDGKSVVIIDFGVSSFREGSSTIVVTRTGMTPEYSAPETFKNLFLRESDYYSFGITLYELFTGKIPYAGMDPEEIELYHSIQRIPFPEDIPPDLQNLISALTYNDIKERNDKTNPNRRWTYDEVNRWLNGESLDIPGSAGKSAIPLYTFMDNIFTDLLKLTDALAKNWEEGKKQLFRGRLSKYFRVFNRALSEECSNAEKEAGKTSGKNDIIFWRVLYKINPDLKLFYWKGRYFESMADLGGEILESLWKKEKNKYSFYGSILSERLLSEYVALKSPKNEKLKENVINIENNYILAVNKETDQIRTLYMMAYQLSNERKLFIANKYFNTVDEFAGYMCGLLDESLDEFKKLCHTLIDYRGKLDIQLQAWLIALGKYRELDKWRDLLKRE